LNDFNTLERTIQKKDEAIEHAITLLADKLNITREAAELMINDDRN
jgi:hypothetical protein